VTDIVLGSNASLSAPERRHRQPAPAQSALRQPAIESGGQSDDTAANPVAAAEIISPVSSSSFAILGTPGFVRDASRFDDEALLQVLGANSGNLMFQFAASLIVDAPKVHVSLAEIPYSDTAAIAATKALIFPAANHLRLGADWSGLNGYLAASKKPLVVLGLGAQSPKIGGEAETIAALKADPQIRRMADILRDQGAFVSVRGPFSQTVCAELGLDNVAVLGCPSALINPDPQIGRKMAERIARLREAAAEGAVPRIAVTAAAPFEIREDPPKLALEQRLFAWVVEAQGLYVQQSGGVSAMRAADGRWHTVAKTARTSMAKVMGPQMDPVDLWAYMAGNARFYLSVPQWRDEMAGLDLCLGTRLHGNMAAIAGGTPGVIIAHDSRTGELGQTMHLPRLTMDEVMAAPDLGGLLDKIAFDGAAFDAWRARTARTLSTAFGTIGIPVSAHVDALARAA
jgi:hypothetical protein